jgi:hypothetical protein
VKPNPLDPTQWIEQLLGAPPFVLGRVDAIEAVGASWVGKVDWTIRGRGSFDLVDLDAVGTVTMCVCVTELFFLFFFYELDMRPEPNCTADQRHIGWANDGLSMNPIQFTGD